MTVWAIVKLQKEGFHFWKDAPETVSFLRNRHRHIFYFTIYVQQLHHHRELEYFMLQSLISIMIPDIDGPESCETIASNLLNKLVEHFKGERKIKVQVTEDNENGALVE